MNARLLADIRDALERWYRFGDNPEQIAMLLENTFILLRAEAEWRRVLRA